MTRESFARASAPAEAGIQCERLTSRSIWLRSRAPSAAARSSKTRPSASGRVGSNAKSRGHARARVSEDPRPERDETDASSTMGTGSRESRRSIAAPGGSGVTSAMTLGVAATRSERAAKGARVRRPSDFADDARRAQKETSRPLLNPSSTPVRARVTSDVRVLDHALRRLARLRVRAGMARRVRHRRVRAPR